MRWPLQMYLYFVQKRSHSELDYKDADINCVLFKLPWIQAKEWNWSSFKYLKHFSLEWFLFTAISIVKLVLLRERCISWVRPFIVVNGFFYLIVTSHKNVGFFRFISFLVLVPRYEFQVLFWLSVLCVTMNLI